LDNKLLDNELLDNKVLVDDKEEHKEVFTLRRISTRSQTQVSQYFTNIEIEEENRICINSDDSKDDKGSETRFDPFDNDDDFNQEINGDLNVANENMV
jgi:hypothetical protein